jgi:hypothetical protein
MELENIMLSKISQTEKDKYHVFSHMQKVELKRNKNQKQNMNAEKRG